VESTQGEAWQQRHGEQREERLAGQGAKREQMPASVVPPTPCTTAAPAVTTRATATKRAIGLRREQRPRERGHTRHATDGHPHGCIAKAVPACPSELTTERSRQNICWPPSEAWTAWA
jgi:hypothetical protein